MAKGKSTLFWELRQSIGQHRFTTSWDGEIISAMKGKKNPVYSSKEKQEARDLRIAGYGGCGKLTRPLLETLRVSFRERKKRESPMNAFMQANVKTLCTASRDALTKKIVLEYDFGGMQVSDGSLDTANVTATVDMDTNKVAFVQVDEVIPGGLARENDRVYACMFTAGAEDHKSMRSLRVDLRDRGEAGSTSALIPAGWNKAALFIYAYAVSADGKYSSPSTRLYPPPTAEELTLAEAVEAYEAAQLRLAVREVTATPEEREAITRAKAGVKKATAAAEKEAVKAKKSAFEIKLAGLEAATRQLKIAS